MSLSCLLTGRRKAILLFRNRISCRPYYNLQMYVMNIEQSSKSTCMVAMQYTNNSVVCGKMPPSWQRIRSGFSKTGTVTFMTCAHNVKIIYFSVRTFRSFNAGTCLSEVALNCMLYRWAWSNQFYFYGASDSVIDWELELELKLFENLN